MRTPIAEGTSFEVIFFLSEMTRALKTNANYYMDSLGDEGNLRFQRAADAYPTAQGSSREPRTPISIPYTTPASEFLYGASVVLAALRANRRTFYKLYLYAGKDRVNLEQDQNVKRLARSRNADVVPMDEEGLRLMNKMSDGRPHNVGFSMFKWPIFVTNAL